MSNEIRETAPIIDKERYQRIIDLALKGSRKIPLEGLNLNDWLSLRAILGIGGSEVAPILGISQYETPFSIWKKKVSDEINLDENDYMTFGTVVEPAIIAWYNKRTKNNAIKDTFIRIHPEHDCLFVNLDGIISEDGKEIGLVECKSTSYRNFMSWENNEEDCVQGIPLYQYCQCMHELSITGLPWVDLAVLITDRRQLKIKRIERDNEYIQKQNEALVKWWNHYVANMIAPELVASEIALLDPATGSFIEADEETVTLIDQYKEASENFKIAEKKKDSLKDQIIVKIGDKENLVSGGNIVATFKSQNRTTLQTDLIKKQEPDIFDRFGKTTSFRVLRIK